MAEEESSEKQQPDQSEPQQQEQRQPEIVEEEPHYLQPSSRQERKSNVVFLRDEQVLYLYEVLHGKDVEPPASNVITCSDHICDEYIEFVARTGRPLFEWSTLKSLFLSKFESLLWDLNQIGPVDHLPRIPNTDRSSARQYIERILSACRSLSGVPFTIQRICELLIQPKKHYKRADKFYRALEKNITVVTTVDEEGRRETKRQPEPIDDARPIDNERQPDRDPDPDPDSAPMEETVITAENAVNSVTSETTECNHTSP